MILYNGSTGSLGAYLQEAPAPQDITRVALRSRLEGRSELRRELEALTPRAAASDEPLVLCHLAARVSVPDCEREPDAAYRTNVADAIATVRDVSDWAERCGKDLRVVYVSSGHVYAEQAFGTLITEDHPVAPRSVYARTKLECENQLRALTSRLGRQLTIARVFGLIAPRQPPHYVLPGLIRRVRQSQVDGIPGLSFVRDYLDARDVCACLIQLGLMDRGVPGGIVNICSGEPTPLRDLLATVARCVLRDRAEALLAQASEAPARPDDIRWIVGDPARLVRQTGHDARRIPIARTVAEAIVAGGDDKPPGG